VISLIFGGPVFLLHIAMSLSYQVMDWLDTPQICNDGITTGQIISVLLNTPMMLLVGKKFFRGAYMSAKHGSFGMDFLITTGTSITYVYSMFQLFEACRTGEPTMHVFLEVSGMLLLFVTIGKFIEAYARKHTASAIWSLLKLQPTTVKFNTTSEWIVKCINIGVTSH
jgi:Cu+-exporting ATPase